MSNCGAKVVQKGCFDAALWSAKITNLSESAKRECPFLAKIILYDSTVERTLPFAKCVSMQSPGWSRAASLTILPS